MDTTVQTFHTQLVLLHHCKHLGYLFTILTTSGNFCFLDKVHAVTLKQFYNRTTFYNITTFILKTPSHKDHLSMSKLTCPIHIR